MAVFKIAYERTNRFEGFYSNDPKDSGGETLYGISRKKGAPFPEFWAIVDEYKKKPGFPNNMKQDQRLIDMKISWYKKNYWDVVKLDEVRSQNIANQLYDISVNKGSGTAIAFANQITNVNGKSINNDVLKRLNDESTPLKNYYS